MGRPLVDHSGKRFGKVTVLHRDMTVPRGNGCYTKFVCKCDCGKQFSSFAHNIKRLESCGCERHKRLLKRNHKHGMYGTYAYENYISAVKRARKMRATPKWADMAKIRQIYAECPEGYEVDHIVPLAGKTVSGLHVEYNLQYLTPKENQAKKNKWSANA